MNILIVLPNWLGDAIMSTPTIESLAEIYPKASFTFVGSFVSIEALKHHPQCVKAFVDPTKKSKSRLLATFMFAQKLGSFDIAITFRKNIYTSLLLRLTHSKVRIGRKTWFNQLLLTSTYSFINGQHLVENYHQFLDSLGKKKTINKLQLHIEKKTYNKPTLGINPGATYGSAKRWYPEKFAKVAASFAKDFDIVIFGGPTEVDMGEAIELELKELGVTNYTNRAGKTSVIELCSAIGGCSFFLTNDSGPMHIAAAYQVPTVSIFGPTRFTETSQWMNHFSSIVHLNLECSPCMKRSCPLKHHDCMKNISSAMVIEASQMLLNNQNAIILNEKETNEIQ